MVVLTTTDIIIIIFGILAGFFVPYILIRKRVKKIHKRYKEVKDDGRRNEEGTGGVKSNPSELPTTEGVRGQLGLESKSLNKVGSVRENLRKRIPRLNQVTRSPSR